MHTPGFIPYGDELLGHYREAHAFVHVALTEGVPQVLYEAMGSGLPIVATDVGGISAALAGGERGLLVPPRNPGALFRSLGDNREISIEHALVKIDVDRDEPLCFGRGASCQSLLHLDP